jgi:cyclophilin family peptidyl-prolyl cis-trans isomerase
MTYDQPATTETNDVLKFQTSLGSFTVELQTEEAPVTCKNFLAYVESGHFTDTVFHRVIPNFMIQGGGMTADMQQKKTLPPIKNEASNGLKNRRGSLAMARTNNPDSATAQFFIYLKDNTFLDASGGNAGYAVFGYVLKGMDVVDKIATVKTGSKGHHDDVPLEPVTIESVTIVTD